MKKLLLLAACCLTAMNASAAKAVTQFAFFADNVSHIYEDETIRVMIYFDATAYKTSLTVINKTDAVVYLDKGTSFVYFNGEATCLYTNASHTNTTGNIGGASVNLGSVAGAMGVGGAIGQALGGVNVGGGTTKQNSTTVYEQRVIMLAPRAGYTLQQWAWNWETVSEKNAKGRPVMNHKSGTELHYTDQNSPYRVAGMLTYSTTEEFAESKQASVSNYVSDYVVGGKKIQAEQLPQAERYAGLSCLRRELKGSGGLWIGLGSLLVFSAALPSIILATVK